MRKLVIFISIFISIVACSGGGACDMAVNKLKSCGVQNPSVTGDCSNARSECEAKCINDAPCDQLKQAFSLPPTPNAYTMCDDACNH